MHSTYPQVMNHDLDMAYETCISISTYVHVRIMQLCVAISGNYLSTSFRNLYPETCEGYNLSNHSLIIYETVDIHSSCLLYLYDISAHLL